MKKWYYKENFDADHSQGLKGSWYFIFESKLQTDDAPNLSKYMQ